MFTHRVQRATYRMFKLSVPCWLLEIWILKPATVETEFYHRVWLHSTSWPFPFGTCHEVHHAVGHRLQLHHNSWGLPCYEICCFIAIKSWLVTSQTSVRTCFQCLAQARTPSLGWEWRASSIQADDLIEQSFSCKLHKIREGGITPTKHRACLS